jgi:putative ABC transport system ATP-binding protein
MTEIIPMAEIIRTEKLKKVFQENGLAVNALRGIDLAIKKGEFIVIAGPSGSGKTTLLNLIGLLDSPTEGKIFLEEREISGLSKSERSELRLRKFGFIFQAYNLIPVLTAFENAEFTLLLQKLPKTERKERVEKLLHDVGLGSMMHRRPYELSGGQQQRVAIARALASDPEIVLADEPTANLDSQTGSELLDLMRKLNEERGVTFVFSTHDHMVIARGKRLVRIRDGLIAEDTEMVPSTQ